MMSALVWAVMLGVSLWAVVHGITGLAPTSEAYELNDAARYWATPAPVLFGFSVVQVVVLIAMSVVAWWVTTKYK